MRLFHVSCNSIEHITCLESKHVDCSTTDDVCFLWAAGLITNRVSLASQYNLPGSTNQYELVLFLNSQLPVKQWAGLLHGDFRCVLWNKKTKQFVIIKERIDHEAIYYWRDGQDQIQLANHLGPLKADRQYTQNINLKSIVSYLHGQLPEPGKSFF